jgi:hypothetical protein
VHGVPSFIACLWLAATRPPSGHRAEKWAQAFRTSTLAPRQGWCGGTRGAAGAEIHTCDSFPTLSYKYNTLFCELVYHLPRQTVQGFVIHAKPVAKIFHGASPSVLCQERKFAQGPLERLWSRMALPSWPYLALLSVMNEGHLCNVGHARSGDSSCQV